MTRLRKAPTHGFTLVELLMVVVLISLMTLAAYPALKTFGVRNHDMDVATQISQIANRARDQAQRRNRAHVLVFSEQGEAKPQGVLTIYEGKSSSCRTVLGDLASQAVELERVPFGQSDPQGYQGNIELDVGLTGWQRQEGEVSTGDLVFCFSPSGALAIAVGGEPTPVNGVLSLRVQLFDGEDLLGPARLVDFTFAGGARLGMR